MMYQRPTFHAPTPSDLQRARRYASERDAEIYVCHDPTRGIVPATWREYNRDRALILQAVVHPDGDVTRELEF